MTKKIVAYQVNREDGEGSVIVFDSHGMAARRHGAQMLDMGGEDEYCTVHRVKEYDGYADKGFVPTKRLLQDGWWWGTAYDGYHLREWHDYDGENGLDSDDYDSGHYFGHWLVFFQNERGVYYNWDEMERHAYSINEAVDRFKWWKDTVTKCYPHLTFTKFTGGEYHYTHTAEYTFPGSKFGGHIRWDWDKDQHMPFESYIANGDKESFDIYMKTVL